MSGADVYIIAEIASSHEGEPALADRLVELAASAGADAVKLQLFRRDALMSHYHPKYDAFGQIEIAPGAWAEILSTAAARNVDIVIEAYDPASLELAESTGVVTGYKIPNSDIGNSEFLSQFAACGKRLFLGVGGATLPEIRSAIDALVAAGATDIVLLHGFQKYPTPIEHSHLARLQMLAQVFGLPTGYADHVDAEDHELARMLPAMALAAGATVIEKHITDDRSRKGRDHYSALNPDEFAEFVVLMRRIAAAVGEGDIKLSAEEAAYRHMMKRQAVARSSLVAGSQLQSEAVAYKRTGRPGLTREDVVRLLGRRLRVDKKEDEPLEEGDFL